MSKNKTAKSFEVGDIVSYNPNKRHFECLVLSKAETDHDLLSDVLILFDAINPERVNTKARWYLGGWTLLYPVNENA